MKLFDSLSLVSIMPNLIARYDFPKILQSFVAAATSAMLRGTKSQAATVPSPTTWLIVHEVSTLLG